MKKQNREDLSNKKFGRLTPVRVNDTISGKNDRRWRIFWVCRCDCGKETTVLALNLKSNHTQSCGCFQKENARKACKNRFSLPFLSAPTNKVFTRYKSSAKNKGIEFSISLDDFKNITKNKCFYCGIQPQNKEKHRTTEPIEKNIFVYNGMDRIDSNKGYSIENIAPCCRQCNSAKSSLSLTNFYNWVNIIYTNLKQTNRL